MSSVTRHFAIAASKVEELMSVLAKLDASGETTVVMKCLEHDHQATINPHLFVFSIRCRGEYDIDIKASGLKTFIGLNAHRSMNAYPAFEFELSLGD